MNSSNDILVFLEPPGDRRDDINRGLVTEGARIARFTGGRVTALTVGPPTVSAQAIEGYGAAKLIAAGGPSFEVYSGEAYAWAVSTVLEDMPFRMLLFAHTDRGSELAPRVAVSQKTAAVTDCTDIRFEDGRFSYIRQPYGGQLEQQVHYGVAALEVATIRTAGLYARKVPPSQVPLEVVGLSLSLPGDLRISQPLDFVPADYRTVDILYARRIVGAGSGVGGSLALVEELSHLLGASIAATRPVVDDGLAPKARMIGQTGKTVAPDLYVALGISGSPHHVAGIQDAGKILSVNIDPKAPMFGFSDAAFVGDLRPVVMKLIERIKRHRNGHS